MICRLQAGDPGKSVVEFSPYPKAGEPGASMSQGKGK